MKPIDISKIIDKIPFDYKTSGMKVEIENNFPYSTDLLYDCLFNEKCAFQNFFLPKLESKFLTGTEFKVIDADFKRPRSLSLGDLDTNPTTGVVTIRDILANTNNANNNNNNNFEPSFKNITLERAGKQKNRTFQMKMSTPIIKKMVNNDENLKIFENKVTFDVDMGDGQKPQKHQVSVIESEQEFDIFGYFHSSIRTVIIPLKIDLAIDPKIDLTAPPMYNSKVIESKVKFFIDVQFLMNIGKAKSLVQAPAKKGCVWYWSHMTQGLQGWLQEHHGNKCSIAEIVRRNSVTQASLDSTVI